MIENQPIKYNYDVVGQVTTVHHPNDKTTTYEYDLLGRKLKVNHPDAGEVTCTYDAAGNLLTKLTAELKKTISDKAPITYTYDYERLSEVLYPKNLFNRVTYTYGKPGEKYNRAGRLVLVEDASGGEAYYYGNQGEVVKTVRSVMVSTADVRTYIYGATYDSWNRVRTMTYPDGEVVTYAYNAAGQIASVKSNKQGKEETIVEKVGYDKDGHTVYTKLGNGTETTYTYDKRRERLQEMNLTAAGTSIMHNKYQYDAVDNILGITNAVDPTRGNTNGDKKLGGAFKHSYAYDDLNRLVYASGKAKQASYSMQMTFGRMSEPLTKVQKVDSTKTAQSYDFTYKYEDSNHPTAPTQIGHEHYTYDANGNPTLVENDSLGTERRMYWDEDNRLMVLSDNGKTSRYTYNAGGERIIKSHGDLEGVYVNGAPQGLTFHETEDYTIYPAPIITVTKNRYTKHYFIGDKRVASKLGVGKFSNVYGISGNNVTAGQKDYAARMMQIEKQREEYYKSLGTPPGVPTMKGATADPDNTGYGYNTIIGELGDHSVPEGWVQHPKLNTTPGTPPGPPIQWGAPEDPDNAQPGYGYIPTDTTNIEDIFFYHSDHLGSTSYITDAKANITQFDAYLPYGELLVDEHSSSEDMPYKFNGKELDEETGLYYYGARYMDPKISMWLGVDPLLEKHTGLSAYTFCYNNPIKIIDPLGTDTVNLLPPPEQDARTYALRMDAKYLNPDPRVINVWGHGNDTGIEYNGKDISTGEEFDNVLKEHSSVWKDHKDGEFAIIVLHSCSTSKFAKKLSESKKFKNVLIIAPDKNIQVRYKNIKRLGYNSKTKRTNYLSQYIYTGVSNNKSNNPNEFTKDIGLWIGYKNGNVYNSYSGDFRGAGNSEDRPGGVGFEYRTFGERVTSFFKKLFP